MAKIHLKIISVLVISILCHLCSMIMIIKLMYWVSNGGERWRKEPYCFVSFSCVEK
jgi:hypothetical protein